jgi:TPR repeat protein
VLSLLLVLSCIPSASYRVGQNTVDGALDELSSEEAAARLQLLLQDPELAAAANRLGASLVDGALEGLSDEERQAVLKQRSEAFVNELSPVLAAAIGDEIGPAARAQMAIAVQEAIQRLAQEDTRADLRVVAQDLTRAIVSSLSPALGEGFKRDAGPAIQVVLEQNVGPAIETLLQESIGPSLDAELEPRVDSLVRTGTQAFTEELTASLNGELGDALDSKRDETGDQFEAYFRSALVGLAALGGLLLAMGAAFRRRDGVARDRKRALELVTAAIKQQELADPERGKELAQCVRDQGRDTQGGRYLSEFLDERKHLKVPLRDREDPPDEGS